MFENENKEDTILLKENKEINKKYHNILDERDYFKDKLKKYKNLEHRSNCPCCDQEINWNDYKTKIMEHTKKLETYEKKLDDIIILKRETDKKLGDMFERINKLKQKTIDEFIIANKKILNKLIKDYMNGFKIELPEIPDDAKSIWNMAIEQLYEKKYDDYLLEDDELLYAI